MSPDTAIWWLRVAIGDLAGARLLLSTPAMPQRLAAYHAQQAAEKALKATIALEGFEPPFTHDLVYLLLECPPGAGVHGVGADVARLAGPHAAARYPAPDAIPFDHDEVELLVRDASLLVTAAQDDFDARGLGGSGLLPA